MTALPSYTGRSLPSSVVAVTPKIVGDAKKLMQCGLSMSEAAFALNVMASDLDRKLMAYLGVAAEDLIKMGRAAVQA